MIDIKFEKLISLVEAAKLLPRRPSRATWWRWSTKGVGGVRLEVVRCGKTIATSKEALQRFLARGPPTESTPVAVPHDRHAAIQAAAAKLTREGI